MRLSLFTNPETSKSYRNCPSNYGQKVEKLPNFHNGQLLVVSGQWSFVNGQL
jgi:hypothetical protein